MAAEVHQHFKTKGIECYLGDGVQSLKPQGGKISLKLNSGRDLDPDICADNLVLGNKSRYKGSIATAAPPFSSAKDPVKQVSRSPWSRAAADSSRVTLFI